MSDRLRTSRITMSSAFLLSASARHNSANFLESMRGEDGARALKDKVDCCESPPPPQASPADQSASRPSPGRGFGKRKHPKETLPGSGRGTGAATARSPGPGAE